MIIKTTDIIHKATLNFTHHVCLSICAFSDITLKNQNNMLEVTSIIIAGHNCIAISMLWFVDVSAVTKICILIMVKISQGDLITRKKRGR